MSTQYVLASPVETVQEAGEVGPGTAGVASAVADQRRRSRGDCASVGWHRAIDPAVPVHSALRPTIEVADTALPFRLDVSLINILMIAFTVWVLYVCFLPSPRNLTLSDDD